MHLTAEMMQKANLFNLIRLAKFIGFSEEYLMKTIDRPDAAYRTACTIARWLKRHPTKKHTDQSRNRVRLVHVDGG